MSLLLQSTAFTRAFLLVQAADHVTGLTGATPAVTLSKAGGAFAAAGGTVTEIANGWYKIVFTTTDTNTLGDLAVHVTAALADPADWSDQIVALNLNDVVRAGLTALPNAVASAAGGLLTFGAGAGQINVDGSGNVTIGDQFKKNIARPNFMVVMTDSTNHAPKSGLGNALTITRNIDNGGFAAGTIGNVSEIGNGWYKFDFGAGDLNGNIIALRITAVGCDDLDFTLMTQP